MTRARKVSYALIPTGAVFIIWLDMGPVLLAGLFSYMIMNLTHRQFFIWHFRRSLQADAADRESGKIVPFQARMAAAGMRLLSVAIFLVLAALLSWMFGMFMRLALLRVPVILATAIPSLDRLLDSYGLDLPFDSLHNLRLLLILKMKENASSVTQASGLLTRRFFQIFIGTFAAISCFWNSQSSEKRFDLLGAVSAELGARISVFMFGFEKILSAQLLISFINMWVTVVFLNTMGIPNIPFLALATFIFGVIPILGNLISNTIIVATSLTVSPQTAVVALLFLVVSHKAEYFLNSRIIGSRIDTPMWQILLGLLVGEALMGVPGVILAPVILHYVREEIRAIPLGELTRPAEG